MHKFLKSRYLWVLLVILGFVTLKAFWSLHFSNDKKEKSEQTPIVFDQSNRIIISKPETNQQQVTSNTNVNNYNAISSGHKQTPNKLQIVDSSKETKATIPMHISTEQADITWGQFVSRPYTSTISTTLDNKESIRPLVSNHQPIICSSEVETNLAKPRLSQQDFDWCKWAISPTGGKVVVGKSWGALNTKVQKERFDLLNCNTAASGKNPSCDDSWGDLHIKNWLQSPLPNNEFSCLNDGKHTSKETCYKNDNNDLWCTLENVQINFSKFNKYSRSGTTPSKKWQQDFISTDCNEKTKEEQFPFNYLYSPQLSSQKCDFIHNGTVLLYSHDDIRNLGHTLNDIMNVWVMLWMSGTARGARDGLNMLNIDSFKQGHNFDDQPNTFFLTYEKNFHSILKGNDYKDKTVCFQKLLIQPIPPRFFIWESWFTDMPCSFIGPSSLYQRWNYHVRHSYSLFSSPHSTLSTNNNQITLPTDNTLKILLIVRTETSNLWGASRTSRNYLNLVEIRAALEETVRMSNEKYQSKIPKIEYVAQDLSKLRFEEQIRLIASSSMMIGTHGAGIASSMHMAIGTKYCCGVLEIYPKGEFSPIKGHGNMARKMGLHYDRIDIAAQHSRGDGCEVPVKELQQKVTQMIENIVKKPTCVLRDVIEDPYLEKL